jgi:hypothetical protein
MRGRGSASSDEFIREVDEAVRQDRWLKLWKEYGAYVVGAALAVVIGTAAGVGWRTWQESQRHGEAERYMAATQLLRQNQPAEAAAAFRALAEESDSGYAVLAHLQAARALGQAGDETGKVAMLSQLADDDAAAPMYRELGDLLALQQQFGAESPDNLTSRLENLTSADNPWRYSALELIALGRHRRRPRDLVDPGRRSTHTARPRPTRGRAVERGRRPDRAGGRPPEQGSGRAGAGNVG